ncbi:MAG TPA: TonB-dependent receptor, partial [Sulfurihydrogenibium azorense]|nr:TonB-dependent receptor [Sulfurihydrogenibium azorense]
MLSKNIVKSSSLVMFILSPTAFVFAQDESPTIKVKVQEEQEKTGQPTIPVERKKATPKTETTVKGDELQIRSGAGGVNVFKAIELTPSVNVQTDDAYGLGGGSIRIRGFDYTQIGLTIDDMPLNDSGNYALYPHEYADVENLESITVERGAVSKKSPFYVEVGGAIRIRTKPPKNRFSIELFPRYGTHNFQKYFGRIDTGIIGNTGVKAFLSYSRTSADKWKGPGKFPEYRDHFTAGISWSYNRLFAEVYFDSNAQLNYFYRGLSYAQALDLDTYKKFDYNQDLIPKAPANVNVNYYKFYKNPYLNRQLRANIEFYITDSIKFTFKPYFWKGRGNGTSATVSSNKIFYRESNNYTDRPGFIADLSFNLPYNSNINLGYWYERANLRQWQPSFSVTVNNDGTYNLSFGGYNYIQKTITTTNSIYLFSETKNLMDRFDLNLGFRYTNLKRDYTSYSIPKGVTIPYYPEDDVYDDPKLVKDNNLSYEKTYRKLLPNFGIGFKVLDGVYGYFAYARNFRVPQNSAAGFTFSLPKNVTAQYIADQLKPEEADSFDLGIRYDKGNFYIAPSVYYVNYKNRLVRVADPTDPSLTYLRNVGKVEAKGFELEIGAVPIKAMSVYASFSYNTAKFKEDYINDGKNNIYIKDKEIPDTPKYMFKVGA